MGGKAITSAECMIILPLSCSKLPSNGPLPQPHSLPSIFFLYCLGAYQGYLLHLPDHFLMLWLVSNLVESRFLHQPPCYLSLSSTRLSGIVVVLYTSSTCFIPELGFICAALQLSDRSVSKSALPTYHLINAEPPMLPPGAPMAFPTSCDAKKPTPCFLNVPTCP